MGLKARVVEEVEKPATVADANQALGEMLFLAVPMQTFRHLSDEAAKRNTTVAALLSSAVNQYIGKTPEGPRLLVETSKEKK